MTNLPLHQGCDCAALTAGGQPGGEPEPTFEQPFAIGHAAANPCRQLACLGCHPRSRFALALEAPRISVIIMTPASPANSRPTNRDTRIGFLPPSVCASAGSHSATGAGSSSTTL